MRNFLYKPIDNSALIVFRILFGILLFLESIGAIFTGWVKRVFIDPEFTFTFISFSWLSPLPGYGMYYYYIVMGILGAFVALGYRYKWSLGGFTILWSITYVMQKSSYNNHYYFLILVCLILLCLPAHRYYSLDAKRNPSIVKTTMPAWCKWIIIAQLFILYTYAAIAKLYPDWLNTDFIEIIMRSKKSYPIIGALLQQKTTHYFLAYAGLLFDGLIIPALLYKPTRKIAFFAAIFFHLFNSIVLQVGIFPYLSLAFSLFFFSEKTIKNSFFKKKKTVFTKETPTKYAGVFWVVTCLYFMVQIALPLRHHFLPGDVLWNEQGHRMSWRMMLRTKSGHVSFKVVDKNTQQTTYIHPSNTLSPKQARVVATQPDAIWQYAQRLKKQYAEQNKEVAIYALTEVSVNKHPFQAIVDPEVDLAQEKWNLWGSMPWIKTKFRYKKP